jgi:hypothetical protein
MTFHCILCADNNVAPCVNNTQTWGGYWYPGIITSHPTGTEDYSIRGKFKGKRPLFAHAHAQSLEQASPCSCATSYWNNTNVQAHALPSKITASRMQYKVVDHINADSTSVRHALSTSTPLYPLFRRLFLSTSASSAFSLKFCLVPAAQCPSTSTSATWPWPRHTHRPWTRSPRPFTAATLMIGASARVPPCTTPSRCRLPL